MLYTLRFSLQNAICFIMLTCLVPVLFTFYIQDVLKLKNNSGAKGLVVAFRVSTKRPKNCSYPVNNLYICDCRKFASALETEDNPSCNEFFR